MKRRHFLKKLPLAASVPFTLNGISMKAMTDNAFARLAGQSATDRVLIILQMHGGNDGLNMLVPADAYDLYYSRRANIAIPKHNRSRGYIPVDSTLATEKQIGFHPDMQPMKELYDQGRVAVVQGVSYKYNNGSHFRGRDIWFMGGGANDYYSSGWIGRFLQQEYAPLTYPDDFPNESMLDPLGIEMGNDVSLIFHQDGNIPTSISMNDPVGFANLVEGLEGFQDKEIDPRGKPPDYLQDAPYWKELSWILSLEDKSEDYAERLYQVYQNGSETSVTYPESYPFNAPQGSKRNPLSAQLKLIARLLGGGCKTRVFLVRIGGFDTHAEQVESYDPTMGVHAALLHHISAAMKAFQLDLRARGMEDRVLTMTTSEFGRRIHSNGSYGTDHGTGGPVMLFGMGVQPGVIGTVPDMNKSNVEMQFDYRQLYANLLKDWMLVDEDTINNDIFFGNFIDGPREEGGFYEPLPVARSVITGIDSFVSERFGLGRCFPNPARRSTTIPFRINSPVTVTLSLYDIRSNYIKSLHSEFMEPGNHRVVVDLTGIPAGIYVYRLNAGFYEESRKLIIIN